MRAVRQDLPSTRTFYPRRDRLPLQGLAVLRVLIVMTIGLGYASTMGIGTHSVEWGHHWGYDPSWYGIQLLFLFSGFLAARSMAQGRTARAFFASRLRSVWPALIAATAFTVLILYPLMCAPTAPMQMTASDLTVYFLKTVFLIDPGAQMPGLLDDAKYVCLMQGAIWTLRWGLILHIAALIGWKTTVLSRPRLLLCVAALSVLAYAAIVHFAVQQPEFADLIRPVLPGLRLGYAYLCGVTLFIWQHRISRRGPALWVLALALGAATTIHDTFLIWTPFIEILGTAFWAVLCLAFLTHAPAALQRCPRLAPVLYVSIWPAAQIVVARQPGFEQMEIIVTSLLLAGAVACVLFLLLRQARVQPARL